MSKKSIERTKFISQNWEYQQINMNIQHLETSNNSLISIASKIQKSSIMVNRIVPPLIKQIEAEIKATLSNLSVRIINYIAKIDKQLNIVKQRTSSSNDNKKNDQYFTRTTKLAECQKKEEKKIQQLILRVNSLEQNIRKNSTKEQKLIEIISNYIKKYKIQDYPSFIQEDSELNSRLRNTMLQNRNAASQPEFKNFKETSQNQIKFIRKIYAKIPQKPQNNLIKRSLKCQSYFINKPVQHITQESRNHRLDYLVTKITENPQEKH